MNIQPAYVTFEQAKALKEKECTIGGSHYYEHSLTSKKDKEDGYSGSFGWKKGETNLTSTGYFANNSKYDSTNKHWFLCEAPEQHEVIEWLRVVHGIWIRGNSMDGINWFCDVWHFGKEPNTASTKDAQIIFASDLEFDSPQAAYSAAIDYVLKELI